MSDEALKGLGLSPDSASYFDVYVYLADQQAVEVDLNVDAPSAGLLDKEKGVQHFPQGARMTVPLASAAVLQSRGLATLRKPERIEQIASRATHTPDACCLLDLRSVCPVFFEFATRVAYVSEDDDMFTTVQGILRERLKKLAAILESECLRTTPPIKSHSLNASVSSFYEALQQHNPSRQYDNDRSMDLEETTSASRKTFIRGLTLSELQALETRKQQLLQL